MKTKYAKLPKKLKITKKNPAVFRLAGEVYYGHLFDRIRYPLYLLRPICWFTKHKNKIIYPYGRKVKQCQRCAKISYRKPVKGEDGKSLYKGEIGQLYGVRFMSTKK